MLAEQLRAAIAAAPRSELTQVNALLWRAWGQGLVSDGDAQTIANEIATRQAIPRAATSLGAEAQSVARRVGSRPKTRTALERRRRWAASGSLPPAIAARFTLGEVAVLAVVAAEHRRHGDCRLTHGEIADVAGVSVSTVKTAMRAARGFALVSIEERRIHAFRNDSNIVRIIDPAWQAWLRLGGGGKSVPGSPTRYKNQQARPAKPARAAPTPMRGSAPHGLPPAEWRVL